MAARSARRSWTRQPKRWRISVGESAVREQRDEREDLNVAAGAVQPDAGGAGGEGIQVVDDDGHGLVLQGAVGAGDRDAGGAVDYRAVRADQNREEPALAEAAALGGGDRRQCADRLRQARERPGLNGEDARKDCVPLRHFFVPAYSVRGRRAAWQCRVIAQRRGASSSCPRSGRIAPTSRVRSAS